MTPTCALRPSLPRPSFGWALGLALGLLLFDAGPARADLFVPGAPPAGAAATMDMPSRVMIRRPPPPPPPPPPNNEAQARAAFQEGTQHFSAARYPEALRAFEAAYALAPRPPLLYNIAICQERMGLAQQAIATYQRYLASTPNSPLEAQIRQTVARLQAQAQAMMDVEGEDGLEGELADPEDGGMAVPPELIDPEAPVEGADIAAPGPRPRASGRFGVALAGYVLALAGGVTAGAFGALALVDDDPTPDACSLADPCSPATLGLLVGVGIAGAGLIWGTTALILELTGVSELGRGNEARATLVPWISPDSVGLSIPGRF